MGLIAKTNDEMFHFCTKLLKKDFSFGPQEKQTKEALTRKQAKGKKKGGVEEESKESTELLKRPKEYTVKFTFPNPPSLSPPILGLHSKQRVAPLPDRNKTQ